MGLSVASPCRSVKARQNEVVVRQAGGCRVSARARAESSQLLSSREYRGRKGGGGVCGGNDWAMNPEELDWIEKSSDCFISECLPFHKIGCWQKKQSMNNSRVVHLCTDSVVKRRH